MQTFADSLELVKQKNLDNTNDEYLTPVNSSVGQTNLYRLSRARIFDMGNEFMKSLTSGPYSTLKKDISCPKIGEGLNISFSFSILA